jgi:antitoxin VapB
MSKTLNLKDPDAHGLAQRVAELTGESMTQAVVEALRERLSRLESQGQEERLIEMMTGAANRIASLPIVDPRSDDEILGYGPDGLFE